MARILGNFILMLLLVLPTTLMLTSQAGSPMLVRAEDDVVEDAVEGEDEDGDATVETDDGTEEGDQAVVEDGEATEGEEEDEKALKPSPDADTNLLFIKPNTQDLPAGEQVRLLVGFTNKGSQEFVVENMEASLRYPQDYTYFIQNFTTARYSRNVEPNREATFFYAFTPSETFNARPFGLTINLNYRDAEGNIFQDAVFNETIQVVEPDEGLDGETFFLYVFLAAVAVLLLVGAQQLLASFGKKRLSKPSKPAVEMGTQNNGDIDYDWIPEATLQKLNRSPGRTPKQSPRQRSSRRNAGSDE